MNYKRIKRIILISIAILMLICGYFIYKGYCLYKYDISYSDVFEKEKKYWKIGKKITVETKKLQDNEYLSFKNVKMKHDFKNFNIFTEKDDRITYILRDSNNSPLASFGINIVDQWTKMLLDNPNYFKDEFELNINPKDFLKKKNINNDIDLYKYYFNNKNVKNTTFTSIKHIKENYILYGLTLCFYFPAVDKEITLINGNYEGFIFNVKQDIQVEIIKNEKKYQFVFYNFDNNYFTYEYIYDFINTIVIE